MIIEPLLAAALHGAKHLAVVAVEDTGVGHEQLEAGHPLGHQLVHGLQRVVVDATDDLVEAVVDGALPGGLVVPRREPVLHALTRALDGEVDDGRGAAPCRRTRPGLERVGGERPAEGQLHVRVAVDAARNHVLAGGVDDRSAVDGQVGAEAVEPGSTTAAILSPSTSTSARERPGGADDGAAADEDVS